MSSTILAILSFSMPLGLCDNYCCRGDMRSCTAAVARVVVLLTVLGKKSCSDNTGAYCRARHKLPVAVLARLASDVANGCEDQLPEQWLWKGRHVKLVDGTTVSMARRTKY